MSKADNDIRYNGAGYYDETAYKAMKNMERGGTSKMDNKTAYTGEIWEMETLNGQTREVLLVQCFNNYATILTLTDTEPEENGLAIRSRSMKWTDCGKLGYVFYNRLTNMVRSMTDEELEEVRDSIGEVLQIQKGTFAELAGLTDDGEDSSDTGAAVETTAAEEENATQSEGGLPKEAAQMMMDSALALEGMTRERDIYKHLYETLLDRVMP